MPRRKSIGRGATMILIPLDGPITGVLAAPPQWPAPGQAPPRRSRSCARRQSRSQFDRWHPAQHSTAIPHGKFHHQPPSPVRIPPGIQRTSIDAPTTGDRRDVHIRICALLKDPRLLLVSPVPPLTLAGDHLNQPIVFFMPDFVHDSKHGISAIADTPVSRLEQLLPWNWISARSPLALAS